MLGRGNRSAGSTRSSRRRQGTRAAHLDHGSHRAMHRYRLPSRNQNAELARISRRQDRGSGERKMKREVTILNAMADKKLFGRSFKDAKTWSTWRVFLAALFALPMTPQELEIYQRCTGRTSPPTEPAQEAWLICGRRAGKSMILAICAVFIACFRDWTPHLAPGERATVMVIASDRRQARAILRYTRGLLTEVPMLAKLIETQTKDGFD